MSIQPDGARIRQIRTGKNLTVDKLAQISNVSARAIEFIEAGRRCRQDTLTLLAKALKHEPSDLEQREVKQNTVSIETYERPDGGLFLRLTVDLDPKAAAPPNAEKLDALYAFLKTFLPPNDRLQLIPIGVTGATLTIALAPANVLALASQEFRLALAGVQVGGLHPMAESAEVFDNLTVLRQMVLAVQDRIRTRLVPYRLDTVTATRQFLQSLPPAPYLRSVNALTAETFPEVIIYGFPTYAGGPEPSRLDYQNCHLPTRGKRFYSLPVARPFGIDCTTPWEDLHYFGRLVVLLAMCENAWVGFEQGPSRIRWDQAGGQEMWFREAEKALKHGHRLQRAINGFNQGQMLTALKHAPPEARDRIMESRRESDGQKQQVAELAAVWQMVQVCREVTLTMLSAAIEELDGLLATQSLLNGLGQD